MHVIRSFKCSDTKGPFETGSSTRFSSIERTATRKLAVLNAAESLGFLRAPPGNRLEALRCDRRGLHSIRINDRWRLCFRWTGLGPEDVEIVDYH
jgi:proteic killer suppression protein